MVNDHTIVVDTVTLYCPGGEWEMMDLIMSHSFPSQKCKDKKCFTS